MNLQHRLNYLEKRALNFKKKLDACQGQRLFIGLLLFASWILSAVFPNYIALQVFAFFVGPAIFIFFAKKSRNFKRHLGDLKELHHFFERQHLRSQGLPLNQSEESSLEEFKPSKDSYLINDLDLFANHSLFRLLDETFTLDGKEKLTNLMLQNEVSHKVIKQRQQQTKNLSRFHWKLARLILVGRQSGLQLSKNLLKDFVSREIIEKSFYRDFAILVVLFALSVGSLTGLLSGVLASAKLPIYLFPALHFFYFLYASQQLKGGLSRATDISQHLSVLLPVFKKIEEPHFIDSFKDLLAKTKDLSPSKKLKSFEFIISALSVQAHPLVYILLNGVLPWSFFFTFLLEKRRKEILETIDTSMDELSQLEASASLALLYKYQTQTFPELTDEPILEFNEIYHPLIEKTQVVANDFTFDSSTHLNLITGSNMAGKSTFLRTVGVNHILMQMGAPVFAKSYKSFPFFLISSIRVSDSLESGFSYFYAEVLRLKQILETTKNQKNTFYLIDEIFRGTNNRERYLGSLSLIQALAESSAKGFISTHDLELTHIADKNSKVKNVHFKDEVSKEKLVFTYKIQSGPCLTTNALKIMTQAGLPIQD